MKQRSDTSDALCDLRLRMAVSHAKCRGSPINLRHCYGEYASAAAKPRRVRDFSFFSCLPRAVVQLSRHSADPASTAPRRGGRYFGVLTFGSVRWSTVTIVEHARGAAWQRRPRGRQPRRASRRGASVGRSSSQKGTSGKDAAAASRDCRRRVRRARSGETSTAYFLAGFSPAGIAFIGRERERPLARKRCPRGRISAWRWD